MLAQDYSTAVQLYSKVLREGEATTFAADAQEYLGLARERNGQTAHAASEYRRYLALYPDGPGAARVQQRLDGLLAPVQSNEATLPAAQNTDRVRWDYYGGLSQYYRRDSLSFDNNDATVQSALLTDIDFLSRRDGDRFAFESRVTAGNYFDIEDSGFGPGNNNRVYYFYADISDADTGLSMRLGRQRMYASGILGRFDGLQAGWRFTEDMRVNVMAGYPVYSSSESMDTGRQFYGASIDILDIGELVDASLFINEQSVGGISDRRAIGGELRYFASRSSLVSSVDFDLGYSELNNFVAIGNWAATDSLTLNAMFDYRRSPYLLAENALTGQPGDSIDDLLETYSETEVRQLAADRSAKMTTVTVGLSTPWGERLQVNADVSMMDMTDTVASGGVPAIESPGTDYFINLNLVAASLWTEGDTTLFGLRYQDGGYVSTTSVSADARFPVSPNWRLNLRLLLAQREFQTRDANELLVVPAVRMFFDPTRQLRLEFEAGTRLSTLDAPTGSTDTQSWFVYTGYRSFF